MFILRATAKLLARAKPELAPDPGDSTGLLGDWYAYLLYVDRRQLILAVSAKTFLPVIIPAREIGTLPVRLPASIGEVLTALEIPAPGIALELTHMKEHRYAKTASRTVLGGDERLPADAPELRRPRSPASRHRSPPRRNAHESPRRGEPGPRDAEGVRLHDTTGSRVGRSGGSRGRGRGSSVRTVAEAPPPASRLNPRSFRT